MRIVPLLLVAASLLSLGGCATIVNGDRQNVVIYTQPPGASVSITNQHDQEIAFVKTPASIALPRGDGEGGPAAYVARVTKPGYMAVQVAINGTVSPNYYGNLLSWGPLGLLVDPATGAMYNLTPTESRIELMRSGQQ